GLRRIVENLVTNFTSFVPLGTVLVALLGVGVAEHSGLISAAIRGLVLKAASFSPSYLNKENYPNLSSNFVGNAILNLVILLQRFANFILAPKILVTVTIVFAAVISNTASEMGYVVLIPLAAVVFYSLGRHPLAGLAAAF